MGDGGVACMPLQQQQQHSNIMERFPVVDKMQCGDSGNINNNNTNNTDNDSGSGRVSNNNGISSNNDNGINNNTNMTTAVTNNDGSNINASGNNSSTVGNNNSNSNTSISTNQSNGKNGVSSKTVKKRIVRVKKIIAVKKGEGQKSGLKKTINRVAENGGGNVVTVDKDKVKNEEVEEGELGTLKWENGEFVPPEKSQPVPQTVLQPEPGPELPTEPELQPQSQLQSPPQPQPQSIAQAQSMRCEVEKGEIVSSSLSWRRGETEKGEIGSWRGGKEDIEKGEFIPDRWHKVDVVKDEYGYSRSRKYDYKLDRTPPSGKYGGDDLHRMKDFSRSGSQHSKSSRWESCQERNVRINSKVFDDESLYKSDYSNGRGRDYSAGNRLKRHGTDSDHGDRKYYGDYGDFGASKSRRLGDDNSARGLHSEHYSRHSAERYYRNSSSSRVSSMDKYSSRHHESSVSSRVVYERHARSPDYSERSPRERGRYYDYRERSPSHRERSPYSRERSPYSHERSPYSWERSPYSRDRSPYLREKSPRDRSPFTRDRSPYMRDRSPYAREKSPYHRSRQYDYRNRSPRADRSPQDKLRIHDRRDRTPNFGERSPHDRSRAVYSRETSRKIGAAEKRNSQIDCKGQEDKLGQRDGNARQSKESQDRSISIDLNLSEQKGINCETQKEEPTFSSSEKSPKVESLPPEELVSMEEDMDICDTPPHAPMVTELSIGKWFYLDYFGMERGPSRLCELKALVEEGMLMSGHLIKHLDSDRWVGVENAVSPLITVNFPSISSDSVTQLVNPPEAPGNLLVDSGDTRQRCGEETQVPQLACPDDFVAACETLEDLHIDDRVGALLEGFAVIPGKEIESLGEILHATFEHVEWQNHAGYIAKKEQSGIKAVESSSEIKLLEPTEVRLERDHDLVTSESDEFSARWSCKGGDWKRNDEVLQEKSVRRKHVLNDGFPLCQMLKSGYEDPRWHQKDDLYYPSHNRKLELPPWAFSCLDDRNEGIGMNKPIQNKVNVARGVKGTIRPVVRINACVVNDHGSAVSDSRTKVRGKERHSSRSGRSYSSAGDVRRSVEIDSHLKAINDQDSRICWKSTSVINTPKDRLCTAEDLQLQLGEWYYLDAAGHERGPNSFSELQLLVDQGVIQKHTSVFRKFDKVWVPITSSAEANSAVRHQPMNVVPSADSLQSLAHSHSATLGEIEKNVNANPFHNKHPQFIAYTRWKLHELVMKSYKREFAAAINEALDPWINAKQPKKETELMYRISEGDSRVGKRARVHVDESDDDEIDEAINTIKDDSTFEELCGDAFFQGEKDVGLETKSWGLLDGNVLARVFHFLRSDMKSLIIASLTCKHWRSAVRFYKGIAKQVDLSCMGSTCSDIIIRNIMNGYNKEKLNSMVLVGCTSVTSSALEEILHLLPCISSLDIRGCDQLGELVNKFPNLNWIKRQGLRGNKVSNELNSKLRSLKQITDKSSSLVSKSKSSADMDDYGELKQYFDSVDKRDSANQAFRRSFYQRSKVFDARRSSSILSRDARTRRWAIKKSENGYKRMEEFLASSLKDIMKENSFDFFIPKVAAIEERMKNGYYTGHGLRSVKDDISRMCRDAIKAKSRSGSGDMNRIVTLFIQLVTQLEQGAKSSYYEREEMMRVWRDESPAVSKYKKKHGKAILDRKYMNRNSCVSSNGVFDHGEYASDRELRKRLSKLNRRSLDSGTETSDDIDRSSEDGKSDSESTVSDTDTDLDFRSRADGYFTPDEGDSMPDEREWGARMTKAGLVPPVTRKYEVIDQYVIVADEEDVKRKMRVSLPEDYAEKLNAQKNGSEELDMELPEVKEYQPRKKLGDQVIEQEVYGIDPYTHNLLLDSMPEELDWTLLEKHLFIEDVLLRTLNQQVRHFTGTGNTPMMYSLQPVIEEIRRAAEEDCDVRVIKVCHGILKAIDNRPDDKYVAYRKGLGVVCNKERGFGKDDFVVEFLGEVYPVWRWYEKQDGIRSLQKSSQDPAPEFYNIYLERPKGDADGYDLVVVDAMHKANYASRICHSCRPNCEAKVTAVDGQYQIGIYTVREIQNGEEITFDYNSVTESKEEYEASVCLCGSQVCRGSYLNLTGEGAFDKVLKEWHGLLDRHQLMIEACALNSVSEEDYLELGRAGLGSCLLGGLPDWVVAYAARLVRFINLERTKLPAEILKHNLEEKRKYFSDICLEVEESDAEVQAEGVYNQRLQNLAVTLDKVRYVMRCIFSDPKLAPPPLEKLSPEETVSVLWKAEDSLVSELLQCMVPHVEEGVLNDLKLKIQSHDPSDSDDIPKELQRSLLWLRDELRNLPCTYKCRNDAAADLIHIYAYTKCFFRLKEYKSFTSPPVFISPLDLGPKYSDKMGADCFEYRKTYGENYCLGQLIFWHIQTYSDPDCTLARVSRGCLSLPEVASFYAKTQKPSGHRVYGPKTTKFMLSRMEKQPQRPWPKDRIWSFKNSPKVFGSPMLDAVLKGTSLDRELVTWLRQRPMVFQAMWDR